MTIILKEPITMNKFGVVFPSNVEINAIQYCGGTFMEHPSDNNLMTRLPKLKSKFTVIEKNL